MKPLLSVAAIVSMAIVSCSPPVFNTFIAEEYKGQKIDSGTLVIVPLTETVVDYFGSVESEFGEGDSRALIRAHFSNMLLESLKVQSSFSEIMYDKYIEKPKLKNTKYPIVGLRNIKIMLPAEMATIRFSRITPDYILFVQKLHIGRTSDAPPGMLKMISEEYLRYQCEFAFWDNKLHRTAAYGRILARTPAHVAVKDNWDDIDRQFMLYLLNQTPFRKQ